MSIGQSISKKKKFIIYLSGPKTDKKIEFTSKNRDNDLLFFGGTDCFYDPTNATTKNAKYQGCILY